MSNTSLTYVAQSQDLFAYINTTRLCNQRTCLYTLLICVLFLVLRRLATRSIIYLLYKKNAIQG